VHQEIGFAIALGIPVLPIVIGQVSRELIDDRQVLEVSAGASDALERLSKAGLGQIVGSAEESPYQTIQTVNWMNARSGRLAERLEKLWKRGERCVIRHRGPFSSFSIPEKDVMHPVWEEYEPEFQDVGFRETALRERRAVAKHVEQAGVRLLLSPTTVPHKAARIETLIHSLKRLKKVVVAVVDHSLDGTLMIASDWFAAISHARRGTTYRHTVFESHAPTVLRYEELFECELRAALDAQGVSESCSLEKALELLSACRNDVVQ
jgi:hypothetical protein